MILHIKSTVNVLHLAVYYINNLVKIQNVHRSITSKTTIKHLLTVSDSWCWHPYWCLAVCLIYRWRLPIKSFRKTIRNRNSFYYRKLLVAHTLGNSLTCTWSVLLTERSLVDHWLSLQMECLRIILPNHPLKTLFTKMQLKRGYTYSSFISVKYLYLFCLESELLQYKYSLLYFFSFSLFCMKDAED